MAWPVLAQLKTDLHINHDGDDAKLTRVLAGAIQFVQRDVGVTVSDPDVSLQQAALLKAAQLYRAGDAPLGVATFADTGLYVSTRNPPGYDDLVFGHRRRWGLA